MKILHAFRVCSIEQHGGVQRSIVDLAAAMDPMRVQHELLTFADDGPWENCEQHLNLKVTAARRSGVILNCDLSINGIRKFRDLAAKADIINYHLPWPFAHAMDRRVPFGTRRIATYHADICRYPLVEPLYRPFLVRFLKRLDGVVCTSEIYKESSQILRELPCERVHTAELGICPPAFDDVALENRSEHAASRFSEKSYMLFLGVTRRYKGVEIAIEALRYTDALLVIAGLSPNRDRLISRARMLGVLDRLIFLGTVKEAEKWALIRRCAAVVMPSTLRSEAFGLALVEAAAGGRPAITCKIGTATTHIVRDGETGLVVPPNNAFLLGRAMQRLYRDVQFSDALGRAAHQRYRQHFTAEGYAMRMHNVYHRVLAENPPGRPCTSSKDTVKWPPVFGPGEK